MVRSGIHRVLFYTSPMALIAAGIINAQTYTSDAWPNRGPIWRQLDPGDSLNWNAGDGYAGFHGQSIVGSRVPVYPTVTVHELAHHVPARATKEYRRALKAQEKGNDYEAVSHYKSAISLDPEFLMAINDLGTTYLRLSKINLATEQFSRAIIVDPRAALPCSNLAIAYLLQNQYRDAERIARRAVDLDRTGTHSMLVLGVSLVLGRQFRTEAETMLSKASMDFTLAKFWLAVGLIQRGSVAQAIVQLKAYVAHPDKGGLEIANRLLARLESVSEDSSATVAKTRIEH